MSDVMLYPSESTENVPRLCLRYRTILPWHPDLFNHVKIGVERIKRLPLPTSPQANALPIGPTTLYLTTSRTIRRCSTVSGCSYMKVFIAGKMYVGVVGVNALSRDVYGCSITHLGGREINWGYLRPGCRKSRSKFLLGY